MKRGIVRTVGQRRSRLAFVLFTALAPCLVVACTASYGPGYGTLTGIIRPCTANDRPGAAAGFSRVVTVSAQNQAGQTVATRHLTRGKGQGVRYSMRLLAGPYSINVSAAGGSSAGVVVAVRARETTTPDFTGAAGCA